MGAKSAVACVRGENSIGAGPGRRRGVHVVLVTRYAADIRRRQTPRAARPQEDCMALTTAERYQQTEGTVARTIESQTAKIPSDTFLWAAVGSMVASASLYAMGNKETSVFVGQWAPTLLILGLYNKLVKQLGSDFTDARARV
jgi:hypothetical protein